MVVGIKKSIFIGEEDSFSFPYNIIDNLLMKHENGGFFVFKLPTNFYWKSMVHSVKYFLDSGFKGVYLSFQRPYNNMFSLFSQFDIDPRNVYILDLTNIDNDRQNDFSSTNFKDMRSQIFSFLNELNSSKKFVFIDSITTMSLINSDKWVNSFSDFLINTTDEKKSDDIYLIFNVAKELANKKIVRNITSTADAVLDVDSNLLDFSTKLV